MERSRQKEILSYLIAVHGKKGYTNFTPEACEEEESEDIGRIKAGPATAWERVEISRMARRPSSLDYIQGIFTDFVELHGDRSFRDDGSVVGGIALLDGQPVTVIGQQKEGPRRKISAGILGWFPRKDTATLRLMKQADKFGRPVINFVDTPGAACGIGG